MKKLILILPFSVLFAAWVWAEVAVKFYSEEPTNHQNRILNIPTNVVSDAIFNTNSAPPGYVLMTLEQYRDHKQSVDPAHRAWLANAYEPWAATNSQPSPVVVSNRQANIQALKALVDTMEAAETNWAGLTTAQVKDIAHTHNQAFLRLVPVLRRLYLENLARE